MTDEEYRYYTSIKEINKTAMFALWTLFLICVAAVLWGLYIG